MASRTPSRNTALHMVAETNNVDRAHQLLSEGVDVNVRNNRGTTPLHAAAMKGNTEMLKFLIKNEADISAKNGFDDTSLHLAARNGYVDIVKELLGKSDLSAENRDLNTPLHLAAMKGHSSVVELLMTKSDVDAMNKDRNTALHMASMNGHVVVVKRLLEADADVTLSNKDEFTSLLLAAMKGHIEVVKELIRANADISAVNGFSDTSLHLAVRNNHTNIVRELLDFGADIEAKNKDKNTPLHLAAMKNYHQVVEVLREHKADINAKNSSMETSLHLAARNGHADVVELLVVGCDINAKNKDGYTALHMAARNGHTDVVKKLIQGHVDVNAQNQVEFTSLHLASGYGHLNIVKELLDAGAFRSVKNNFANTALHLAAMNGHCGIVKKLIETDAEIDAKNDNGYTPLHSAASNGHPQVIKLLVTKGSDINAQGKNGFTPFYCAIASNKIYAVRELVDLDADKKTPPNCTLTPLQFAARNSNSRMVEYLVKDLSLDPEEDAGKGGPASAYADRRGEVNATWMLRKRQTQPDPDSSKEIEQSFREICSEESTIKNYLDSSEKEKILRRLRTSYDSHLRDASGMTILHWAAKQGHDTLVRDLIKDCAMYPFIKTFQGQTPADLARQEGHTKVLQALEENPYKKVRASKEELYGEFLNVISTGDSVKIARDMLWAGTPLSPTGMYESEPLTLAVEMNRPQIVSLLVATGAPLTTTTRGVSLLNATFRNSDITVRVKALILRAYLQELLYEYECITDRRELTDGIEKFLDLSESPVNMDTILDKLKADKGYSKMISEGKWPSSSSSEALSFLLTEAAKRNCPLVCSLLYQAGAKAFLGRGDENPVTVAIENQHWKTLKFLVRSMGASPYACSSVGSTPLLRAPSGIKREIEQITYGEERRRLESFYELRTNDLDKQKVKEVLALQKDLYSTHKSYYSMNPTDLSPDQLRDSLLMAAQRGLPQLILLLLNAAKNTDVNIVVDAATGTTSLHQAASHGNGECVALLLSRNADPCRLDRYGYTAMHHAALFGHQDEYLLLHQHGVHKDSRAETTPEEVKNGFTKYLQLYEKYGQKSLDFKDVSHCLDPSEASAKLLNCLEWKELREKVEGVKVDFSKGEAKEVKEAVINELRMICEYVESANTVYKGELELLGSSADGTKLYAPDEFDVNLVLDENLLTNSIKVVDQEASVALGTGHSKAFKVETCNPDLQGNNLVTKFYDLVKKSLEAHSLVIDRRLRLVPPGVTRTQVGVALSMVWQGKDYPLLLIRVDLVPVVKVRWTEEVVPRPYLTPLSMDTFYITNTLEKEWRCSFAGAETAVLQNLEGEDLEVYIISKFLLSCMKPEPWMSMKKKKLYTWWGSRQWKIPVPSNFALKNAFLKFLNEKKQRHDTEWSSDELLRSVLLVFGHMCRDFNPSASQDCREHDKIQAYFGGEFEAAKVCVGAPEVVKYLRKQRIDAAHTSGEPSHS